MENKILNEELNNMKYLFGYQRGVVISEQDQDLNEFWGKKVTMDDVIEKLENLMDGKTADGKKELDDELKMNSNQKEGLRNIIKSIKSGKLDVKASTINYNISNSNAKATAKEVIISLRDKGGMFKV
jgi:CHASE3 domain sensor protein